MFQERPGTVHHPRDEDDKKTDQFKIGPVIGGGLPSLLSVGGMIKVTRFLGAGVSFGLIPKVKLSYYGEAELSYQHIDIYGRIFPFGGAFFLGAGAGYATAKANVTTTVDTSRASNGLVSSVQYDGNGSVKTLVLTALIGFFYTTDVGFSIGVDAGAQIPIAPSDIDFSRSVASPGVTIPAALVDQYVGPTDKSVRDTLEKIGRTTLPTLNLRIGWLL